MNGPWRRIEYAALAEASEAEIDGKLARRLTGRDAFHKPAILYGSRCALALKPRRIGSEGIPALHAARNVLNHLYVCLSYFHGHPPPKTCVKS